MPRYRPEIAALTPYEVGRPIEDVVREYGVDPATLIRLTANESPEGPFPGVLDAVAEAISKSNRYPDNQCYDLAQTLSAELGVDPTSLMFGSGSVSLLADIVSAVGGPGTNVVYGWPSFIMYRFAAIWAGSGYVEVPLEPDLSIDLEAISRAIDGDTRVVFICNPNNPTGTIKKASDIEAFIESMPDTVVVAVDEAYHDFVDDPRYESTVRLAAEHPHLVTLRTFSKIYSLAAHRIGYAVGHPETLKELRKVQVPLTVGRVAQAAALASLGQPDEVQRRAAANAAGRHHLVGALAERGLEPGESHTNFVFFKMPGDDSAVMSDAFTRRGVIIRPMSRGWMRVTVGSPEENRRFVDVLDGVLESSAG